ncbi:chlorocatechol-degradation protein [Meredithblackwellia eburnea MCA 4105]
MPPVQPGECCIKGVIHEGESKGTIRELGGVKTYVALESGGFDSSAAIILLPEVFGLELINARLLADSFAANGFQVYIPDFLAGEAVPLEVFHREGFDLWGWLGQHPASFCRPHVEKLVETLKGKGVKKMGAVGYCFGAREVVGMTIDGIFDVSVVAHPSLIRVPEDLQLLKAKSTSPFLWQTAAEDYVFTPEHSVIADKIFEGASEDVCKRINYEAGHGFASRGDLKVPEIKAEKERAFDDAVKFFQKHLRGPAIPSASL